MDALVVVSCAVLGLVVGSFLNVVVWRVPRGESVVSPPSHCPGCDTPLTPLENVPVVSWVALRGRCRTCGTHISARYPVVELACAGLWTAMALRFGATWELPAYLVLSGALLALSMIDLETFLLPNKIV
jgi:leader peptidase (prepilin peptidase)/N-methyltransferase